VIILSKNLGTPLIGTGFTLGGSIFAVGLLHGLDAVFD